MLYSNHPLNKKRVGGAAKRLLSVALCAAVLGGTVGSGVPASAETINPSCDETYYATLDCYGKLKEGSVVKSYNLNGASSITDYGTYTKINNLTDDKTPTVSGDKISFNTSGANSGRFYFEGKTAQPYTEFPWTMKVSYRLNGVEAKAEEIAGKTGLVEINVDATPNKSAGEYYRNNLVLLGMTAFNADDILSLEAQGAQVQLLGNLRTVLFAAMPGETQHICIKVGSNSFTSSGLTFLAVPATLSQLSQIADLRKAKSKTENSYDSISKSLDTILDSLDGIGGNLNDAADGLDQLNEARASVSEAQGDIENSIDIALYNFDSLSDALQPLSSHLDAASKELGDINSHLNALTNTLVSLKTQLAECRSDITSAQKDGKKLNDDLTDLRKSLDSLNTTLTYLKSHNALSPISKIAADGVVVPSDQAGLRQLMSSVDGYYTKADTAVRNAPGGTAPKDAIYAGEAADAASLSQLWAKEKAAGGETAFLTLLQNCNSLHTAYESYLQQHSQSDPTDAGFQTFITGYLVQSGETMQAAQQKAQALSNLYSAEKAAGGETAFKAALAQANTLHKSYEAYLSAHKTSDPNDAGFKTYIQNALAEQLYEMWLTGQSLGGAAGMNQMLVQASSANAAIDQVNSQIASVNNLMSSIAAPTASVVSSLNTLCGTLGANGLLGDVNKAGGTLTAMTHNADTAIDQIAALNQTLNNDLPETQRALADSKKAAQNVSSGVKNTDNALRSLKSVVSNSGSKVDASTKKSLESLSKALRESTKGFSGTGDIRSSKKTINDLVKDEWDSHTGGSNNVLLMNPSAKPVSMTSSQNTSPHSVQMIFRTQEIKVGSAATVSKTQNTQDNTNFWQRVGNVFVGLWNSFTGLFKH